MPNRLLSALILLACLAGIRLTGAEGAPPASDLAELPHWPVGIDLPAELYAADPTEKPTGKARVMAWVPPGAQRIRGMLLILNNTDSKEFGQHPSVRAACAARELAIVYLRFGMHHRIDAKTQAVDEPAIRRDVDAVMGKLADHTGIAEFRHAPWITFGKSSSSQFPFVMAWLFPERTIGGITYHGEVPYWPPIAQARTGGENLLWVNANGETEWGGTWWLHVRPGLLNYRDQKGWRTHQAVAYGVGHGDYIDGAGSPNFGKPFAFPEYVTCVRVWDYLAVCIDRQAALRLPTDAYPTERTLPLRAVDDSQGYCVDPFAVEALFAKPRRALKEADGVFQLAPGEAPVDGYAAFAPLPDFTVPDGVPVVLVEPGRSPVDWLLTDSLKFAMQADPMTELGPLAGLMPKPGDQITVDGKPLTFQRIQPKHVAKKNGGIALNTGLRPPNGKVTLFAYTVLDIPQAITLRVGQGFTEATRVQLVLNGVPVRHRQVLDLKPGRYPLLVAMRVTANWGSIEPNFDLPSAEHIALAKEMQAENDRLAVEEQRLRAAGPAQPPVIFRQASTVPEAERRRMFWVADREQAQAWLDLHNVKGIAVAIP